MSEKCWTLPSGMQIRFTAGTSRIKEGHVIVESEAHIKCKDSDTWVSIAVNTDEIKALATVLTLETTT